MYNDTDKKIIHYYLVEKIMAMQLFDIETDIILNFVEGDLKAFKQKHSDLGSILKKIYEFRGCFSRIELAKCVLKEYFEVYRDKNDEELNVADIKNRIEHTDVVDEIRERLYIEEFLFEKGDEIYIGNYINKAGEEERVNSEIIKDKLTDYYRYEENIRLDNVNLKKHIKADKIKEIVSSQLQEKGKDWITIKKWVIWKSL